ncbi:hypothetical protein CR513_25835, partial [Mucuna pruriens]
MATTSSASQGSIISFSGTPTITTKKLNWKNYRAWSESVELWFLGQGLAIPSRRTLEMSLLMRFNTNHDMVSHIAKARAAVEELKGLLVCNSVEETTKQIDKLLMVLILRSLHPDCEHVHDQILSSEQIPSMNSLVTRLFWVPTITKGDGIAIENSVMIASRGRGRSGWGTRGILRNGKGGRGSLICSHYEKEGHLQNRCYDLIGWPDKTTNISSSDTPSNGRIGSQLISDEEYQEFLRLKSNNHTQSSTAPSVSNACISQSIGSQGPEY